MFLELENISVVKGSSQILDRVSFALNAGDRVLVKGASGSGKSTLARAMLMFEKLSLGKIVFNGACVDERNLRQYRESFAYMGQTISSFDGTGKEFVNYPFGFKANRHHAPACGRINAYLDEFGLVPKVLELPFASLSGGQKQRLSLIRCLLLDRPILLIDEATSGLDENNLDRVVGHICSLEHKTLITISHSACWQPWCNRVVELEGGRVLAVSESGGVR